MYTYTPLSTFEALVPNDGSLLTNAIRHRQVIGSLQLLFLTHVDISFVVNKLA